MVKSVDGGGGRGLRLVRHAGELREKVDTCVAELSLGRVFVEMAAVDGFRNVEMQVIGDGSRKGGVRHLWEGDRSVQRRFQKIVEVAPCLAADRRIIVEAIEAAVKMAEINYLGLWEFLVNAEKGVF
jgi:pyruvate carboxylase